MKGYQIKDATGVRDVDESDIHELFNARLINQDTPCRQRNSPNWKTVNDNFPLLKYGVLYEPLSAKAGVSEKVSFRPFQSGPAIIASIAVLIAAVSLSLHFIDRPGRADHSIQKATEIAVLEERIQPAPRATPIRIDTRPPSPMRQDTTFRNNPPTRQASTFRRSTPAPQPQTTAIAPQAPPVETETLAQRRRRNEFQIPKYQWAAVPGLGQIKIVEDTPISVTIEGGLGIGKRRFEKHKGFEGNNFTPLGNGVFYVDTARSSPGKVTLTTDR